MTKLETNIYLIIEILLKENRMLFNKSEIGDCKELISVNILKESEDNIDILVLTPNELFYEHLLMFIETQVGKQFPLEFSGAFKCINDFKENKRKEYKINIVNAYDKVIKGLKTYVLNKFKREDIADPREFLITLKDIEKKENHLYSFERVFMNFLPYSGYSAKEIAEMCIQLWDKENLNSSIINFLREYGSINTEKANDLLIDLNSRNSPLRIASHLLIGLYDAGDRKALEVGIKLKEVDCQESLFVLARIKYANEIDIENIFKSVFPLNFEDENVASEQSYLLFNLINSSASSEEIKAKSFQALVNFIEKGTDKVLDIVFHGISTYLDDFEADKYNLMLMYLSKTKKIKILNRFFDNFKNPQYIFNYIIANFENNPQFRFKIELFRNGISQAWQTNQVATENIILNLFKEHPLFSILAVKIIQSSHHGVYNVNLLKLKEEEAQINAIKGICKSPICFDELIPILLELRKSKFKKTREFLQRRLSEKVFYSYHESIFKLIEKEISDSEEDQEFIKPIKESLDNYYEVKKIKESVKDIDPRENESDLMEFYYRLEREENAKAMDQAKNQKGFLSQIAKNIVIVRGNSWKHGEQESRPLADIRSEMLVDAECYLNPDLYEINLNKM
ncbi:hypothetical protein GQR60_11510 [Labilibaculum sp. A4]|uniref:hypothetical protein n=1 Tax=Labilibaculum euxinus TaxID=2686357 RepID=UPI000F62346E|nr:hypothetical protein [Labilibaculum euxinus]MDQ1771020.1 hypothetical protein [Labilibaculum euxinus]MWN76969.1 hypothetical protein [Labilibaculum euxinus]